MGMIINSGYVYHNHIDVILISLFKLYNKLDFGFVTSVIKVSYANNLAKLAP